MAQLTNRDDYMNATTREYRWYLRQHPDRDPGQLLNMPLSYTKKQMTDDGWWHIGDIWNQLDNLRVAVHWEPKSDRVRVGRAVPLRSGPARQDGARLEDDPAEGASWKRSTA